MEVMREWFTSY